MRGSLAFRAIIQNLPKGLCVLDVGCGEFKPYTRAFCEHGYKADSLDFNEDFSPSIAANLDKPYFSSEGGYDIVWCCHTLEHARNPGIFLENLLRFLKKDGWLAITVPPLKHEIVGGHVTLWNPGLLLYNIILAGQDCSNAFVFTHEYDITVIVQKKPITLPELKMDAGDIELLAKFFPFEATQGFDGTLKEFSKEKGNESDL